MLFCADMDFTYDICVARYLQYPVQGPNRPAGIRIFCHLSWSMRDNRSIRLLSAPVSTSRTWLLQHEYLIGKA